MPDISKTLDEKTGTREGVVAATESSGGSPLIRAVRDLDLKVICNNIGLWTPNVAFFLLAFIQFEANTFPSKFKTRLGIHGKFPLGLYVLYYLNQPNSYAYTY